MRAVPVWKRQESEDREPCSSFPRDTVVPNCLLRSRCVAHERGARDQTGINGDGESIENDDHN